MDGFGQVVAADLGMAIAGIDVSEASLPSNTAMLRAMRDATIDWGHPALINLTGRTGGRPMPAAELERFNAAFDHDFSHVRLHADDQAAQAAQELHAHAFALGADIFFGPGEYSPGTPQTDRVLAHELTHVEQHDEGRLPSSTSEEGVSDPSDPHEQEAYANEDRIVGKLAQVDTELAAEPAVDVQPSAGLADGPGGVGAEIGPSEESAEGSDSDSAGADAPAMLKRYSDGAVAPGPVLDLVTRSRGSKIPASVADRMSSVLGHDVSDVQIHTDAAAEQASEELNALAFSLGSDVFFGAGQFAPGTADGDRLLAHELTHVVQHDEGQLPTSAGEGLEVSDPSDVAEQEADAVADEVVSAGPVLDAPEADETAETAPLAGEADQAPAMREAKGPPAPSSGGGSGEGEDEEEDAGEFSPGDLVWVQTKGRERLPAIVIDPTQGEDEGEDEKDGDKKKKGRRAPKTPPKDKAGKKGPAPKTAGRGGGDEEEIYTVVTIGPKSRRMTVEGENLEEILDIREIPLSKKMTVGARVWAQNEEGIWQDGVIVGRASGGFKVQLFYDGSGKQEEFACLSLTPKRSIKKDDLDPFAPGLNLPALEPLPPPTFEPVPLPKDLLGPIPDLVPIPPAPSTPGPVPTAPEPTVPGTTPGEAAPGAPSADGKGKKPPKEPKGKEKEKDEEAKKKEEEAKKKEEEAKRKAAEEAKKKKEEEEKKKEEEEKKKKGKKKKGKKDEKEGEGKGKKGDAKKELKGDAKQERIKELQWQITMLERELELLEIVDLAWNQENLNAIQAKVDVLQKKAGKDDKRIASIQARIDKLAAKPQPPGGEAPTPGDPRMRVAKIDQERTQKNIKDEQAKQPPLMKEGEAIRALQDEKNQRLQELKDELARLQGGGGGGGKGPPPQVDWEGTSAAIIGECRKKVLEKNEEYKFLFDEQEAKEKDIEKHDKTISEAKKKVLKKREDQDKKRKEVRDSERKQRGGQGQGEEATRPDRCHQEQDQLPQQQDLGGPEQDRPARKRAAAPPAGDRESRGREEAAGRGPQGAQAGDPRVGEGVGRQRGHHAQRPHRHPAAARADAQHGHEHDGEEVRGQGQEEVPTPG
ncbi:MAG: eCIS core domain-containing protein [Planctomycetota bacterium]|jgi:hypothetical protein